MTFPPRQDDNEFFKIADSLSLAVFSINSNHEIIFWNEACARLTGLLAVEMVGTKRSWASFYAAPRPLLSDLIVDHLPYDQILKIYGPRIKQSGVMAGGLEKEEYFSSLGEKGKWISFSAAPVKNAAGEVVGAVETVQDITTRKFDEEILKNSAEELNAIFQNSGDAVCVFGINYDILKVNRAMEELFRMPASAFVGKKCYSVLGGDQCQTKECPLQRILAGEERFSLDAVKTRSDGVQISVECVSTPIRYNNIVIGMISSFRDVTQRKKSEEQIRQMAFELQRLNEGLEVTVMERTAEAVSERKKAEEANMAKSMFLANMSHEFRTPLHGIINFSDFGIEKYASAPKEKILNYFKKINNSSHVLLSLVNDLLDLVKLESGKMIFVFSEVNVASCVQNIIDEVSEQASLKRISIILDEPLSSQVIALDEEKVLQVLRNLLSNAIKFSPEGGVIKLTMKEDRDAIRVGVLDNGIGVPEAERESIFDKFVQSTKTRTGAGGTGLGLAISKEIVEMHHGRIWVENNPEGGSIFYFTISKYLNKKY
ncbi:MAG: PAS domain-containing sensor histidine kinase [Candidatus Omnitrophota bacterium]